MLILRDEKKIQQRKRISQILSFVSIGILITGFILGLRNMVGAQLISLAAGFMLSQVAVYMAHRYVRTPRPDQLLDDALRKSVKGGRMYHFVLPPAPHVLLTPSGPIIFHLKYQAGDVSVSKDSKGRDKWQQKKIGFFRRFFGQESLGNPTREAEIMVESMANFLRRQAPEVAEEEIPIGVIIVFTHSIIRKKENNKEVRVPASLDLKAATFTAMHVSKLRGYLRSNRMGEPLPADTYAAIQAAFDKKADNLLGEDQELLSEET